MSHADEPMSQQERRLAAWIGLPTWGAPRDVLSVAVHESGHALAAALLGMPFPRVVVDAVSLSGALHDGRTRLRDQRRRLVVAFGGVVADALTGPCGGGWITDLRIARDTARNIRREDRAKGAHADRFAEPAQLRAAFEECWELLEPWTGEILELAAILATEESLTGRRVRRFLDAARERRWPAYWLSERETVLAVELPPFRRLAASAGS